MVFFLKTFSDIKSHLTFVPDKSFFLLFLCYFSFVFRCINVYLKVVWGGNMQMHTCLGKMTECLLLNKGGERFAIKDCRREGGTIIEAIKIFNSEL